MCVYSLVFFFYVKISHFHTIGKAVGLVRFSFETELALILFLMVLLIINRYFFFFFFKYIKHLSTSYRLFTFRKIMNNVFFYLNDKM